MEASEHEEKAQEPSLLQKIRNMWEFSSVMQFIFTFGKAVKIDEDFDIEVCPPSTSCASQYDVSSTWRSCFDARNG